MNELPCNLPGDLGQNWIENHMSAFSFADCSSYWNEIKIQKGKYSQTIAELQGKEKEERSEMQFILDIVDVLGEGIAKTEQSKKEFDNLAIQQCCYLTAFPQTIISRLSCSDEKKVMLYSVMINELLRYYHTSNEDVLVRIATKMKQIIANAPTD